MTVPCLAQPSFWAAAQAPRASLLGDGRGWEPATVSVPCSAWADPPLLCTHVCLRPTRVGDAGVCCPPGVPREPRLQPHGTSTGCRGGGGGAEEGAPCRPSAGPGSFHSFEGQVTTWGVACGRALVKTSARGTLDQLLTGIPHGARELEPGGPVLGVRTRSNVSCKCTHTPGPVVESGPGGFRVSATHPELVMGRAGRKACWSLGL